MRNSGHAFSVLARYSPPISCLLSLWGGSGLRVVAPFHRSYSGVYCCVHGPHHLGVDIWLCIGSCRGRFGYKVCLGRLSIFWHCLCTVWVVTIFHSL